MTEFETYMLGLGVANFLVVGIGLGFAGWQALLARRAVQQTHNTHQADHDWNRRIAAQAALEKYSASVVLSELQQYFSYLDRVDAVPLDRLEAAFGQSATLRKDLHQLLNFYESLARGVSQGIYDEQVIKAGRKGAMTRAHSAFLFYIRDRRVRNDSPRAWCDLEWIVTKWAQDDSPIALRNPTQAG